MSIVPGFPQPYSADSEIMYRCLACNKIAK